MDTYENRSTRRKRTERKSDAQVTAEIVRLLDSGRTCGHCGYPMTTECASAYVYGAPLCGF